MSATMAASDSGNSRTKKRRWLAAFGLNSMLASVLLHVLFVVVATYLIVEHFQKKHINFHATAPPGQHTDVEHKIEMAKKNNVESAPPDLKRIVTTAVSPITLPDIPEVPQPDEITPTAMSGVNGVLGSGMGSGLGNGNGAGGGAGGSTSVFGDSKGTGLVGYMYDLKQTRDGKPMPDIYSVTVDEFLSKHFNDRVFAPFYRWDSPIYATQIFIPNMSAEDGPKAFGADKVIQPSRWVIHYKGRVSPPSPGTYRFWGCADDVMAVAINGKTELVGNRFDTVLPNNGWKASEPDGAQAADDPLRPGDWFTLKADEIIDLDIIIGERPGGYFNAFVMVEKQDDTYKKDAQGHPILPIFQLAEKATPVVGDLNAQPLFSSDPASIWTPQAPASAAADATPP